MDDLKRAGILFALFTAVVSGISVFVNGFVVKGFDPFLFTTLKNALVAILLFSILILLKQRKEILSLTRTQWKSLFLIGLIGGSAPFLLFFWGLSLGNASVSSFIFRMTFVFATFIAFFYLKEKVSTKFIAGGLLVLLANILLISGDLVFGFGQLLVLIATVLWSAEYTYSRKIVQEINPRIVAWGRMFFGSVILLVLLGAFGKLSLIQDLAIIHWQWILITAVLLLAFVLSWYASLRYVSVSIATSILALGGPITAVLGLMFQGKTLPFIELASLFLTIAGVIMIVGFREMFDSLSKLFRLNASPLNLTD